MLTKLAKKVVKVYTESAEKAGKKDGERKFKETCPQVQDLPPVTREEAVKSLTNLMALSVKSYRR